MCCLTTDWDYCIFFFGLPTFLCTSGHEVSCFGSVGRCDLQAGKEAGSAWFLVQPYSLTALFCSKLGTGPYECAITGEQAALTAVALWTYTLKVHESNLVCPRETETEVCQFSHAYAGA